MSELDAMYDCAESIAKGLIEKGPEAAKEWFEENQSDPLFQVVYSEYKERLRYPRQC